MRPIWKSLYVQVLGAIGAGVLLGYLWPDLGAKMRPFGDGFISLIKMMIAPIIFLTVVIGIARMGDMKHVGRIGVKAILYFEVLTTCALALGLVVAHVLQPGAGMHIDVARLDAKSIDAYRTAAAHQDFTSFVLNIIPTSFGDAFAKGDLLQVLLVALLFGSALTRLGPAGHALLEFLERLSQVFFGIVTMLMKLAPIGAFGAMAFTVGKFGLGTLGSLGFLLVSVYATCLLFVVGVLGLIARLSGFSLWRFLRFIQGELLLVLATSSSEPALPRMMKRLEEAGCDRAVVGLVLPTGYSFNLDGTCIYLTMAALFVAQALDVPLTLGEQLTLLGVLLLTSKGAAGVTGSGFITLAATLSALHGKVPVEGVALIIGVDRFMSEVRAITNTIGNGVATLVVARWEGLRDDARMEDAFLHGPPVEEQAPALEAARPG
ncbi:C4-dicarboxylate transporter DctA [Corallococcus sp. H22C18031201]|uniref:dicarboxylate/amino acid:cation symporter n=1 Tax=Citreicoccus inhibens TaxID=2849499 RepID=UPI000E74F9A7|nr:dicarboxylate/amino acid:cation symporter [Citreicoccus inhibens]MBU8895212.1 dicarboxylate/amino acid:cation symporter [Citreicoccus inhibens]RJS27346.1 C4-dicarboxylate transporter DctA [Corallococcus sp. H22C18031201]